MSACKLCEEPLFFNVEEDDVEEEKVPDDLALSCGCHFHWYVFPGHPRSFPQRIRLTHPRECLISKATEILSSLTCPSCTATLAAPSSSSSSTTEPILTTYTSEGGTEPALDILPVLTEESYLATNPHARPARALHIMATEGDVYGAVELLHAAEEEDPESLPSLVLYRDPLAGSRSALHLAVEGSQEGFVWLLLWIASVIPEGAFPDELRALAEAVGLERMQVEGAEDVRGLWDDNGDTAEALAQKTGAFVHLQEAGVLTPLS